MLHIKHFYWVPDLLSLKLM